MSDLCGMFCECAECETRRRAIRSAEARGNGEIATLRDALAKAREEVAVERRDNAAMAKVNAELSDRALAAERARDEAVAALRLVDGIGLYLGDSVQAEVDRVLAASTGEAK